MPLCNLHLIALNPGTSPREFLSTLRQHSVKVLSQALVVRWMILPTHMSTVPLLAHNVQWDLLVILDNTCPLPEAVLSQVAALWSATCGIPSALVKNYTALNSTLFNPSSSPTQPALPKTNAESTQKLQLSDELAAYVADLPPEIGAHPVSMLNLLAFNPGKKEQYQQYGKAFSEKVGARHGGKVKVVGNVVAGEAKEEGWDEIAYVHYPTLAHFAAMAGDKDYQEVNERYRLGALKDTFILCTMEIDDHGRLAGTKQAANSRL
ncbi:hypothetical protein QBC46DRAFT_384162 [Diplogelasinospora grovesii]|uniref:DUF1330 domain-containing protein n=1 Tax=Diplogelasinospora grovesii TaxID=303347 RepID=A0AAN6N864_9PEZI|nr:hypothetical protein QBC46DRAFT_384162 [Diplogelasinospora grovesii]